MTFYSAKMLAESCWLAKMPCITKMDPLSKHLTTVSWIKKELVIRKEGKNVKLLSGRCA